MNPEQLDVIAVGAHPDDIEIGCGGTVAKLVEQGFKVGMIDLTDGEPTPVSPGPEVRMAEAAKAAEILGAAKRITLDLPNRVLMDSPEARYTLATEFRRYRPKLILGLGDRTPLASPDHWQTMNIVEGAVFYSRLTKWDDDFAGLPPHTIAGQLYYSLSFHSLETSTGPGQIVADISDTLEKKLASVRCYASQFPPEKEYIYARIKAWAERLGQAARYEAGELFVSPRPLGTGDLMTLVG